MTAVRSPSFSLRPVSDTSTLRSSNGTLDSPSRVHSPRMHSPTVSRHHAHMASLMLPAHPGTSGERGRDRERERDRGRREEDTEPVRPWSPSILHNVNVAQVGSEGSSPNPGFPAPPTGHELMSLFPAKPPSTLGGNRQGVSTSEFFEQQERAFFARAGAENPLSRDRERMRRRDDETGGSTQDPRPKSRTLDPSSSAHSSPMSGITRVAPMPAVSSPHTHPAHHVPPSSSSPHSHPVPHPHTGSPAGSPPVQRRTPPLVRGQHPYPAPPPPPPSAAGAMPPSVMPQHPHSGPPYPHGQYGHGHPGQPPVGPEGAGPSDMPGWREDDEAWRRPMPHSDRRRAGKHTRRVIRSER